MLSLLSADFFLKINFLNIFFFRNTILVHLSVRLDPDQVCHCVQPDLGPTCLQRLSADDTRRLRVNN